jgi:hypothetical protein
MISLVTVLVGYIYAHKEEIKQQALTQINTTLQTNIEAERIGLNLFKNFPQIGLGLEEVRVEDGFKNNEPLLQAEKIFIGFNIWDMINKKYKIHTLKLEGGQINLYIDQKGRGNYLIFSENDTSSTEPVLLHLQKVIMKNMSLHFEHKILKQQYHGTIEQANWKVEIDKNRWVFGMQNELFVKLIQFEKQKFISQKKVNASLLLQYDLKQDRWTFNQTNFSVNTFKFQADGYYQTGKKHDDISVQLKTNQLQITELLSVLPIKSEWMNEWKSNGDVILSGKIEGKIGGGKTPDIDIQFGITQGELHHVKHGTKIQSIQTKGSIKSVGKTYNLIVPEISMQLNESSFTGEFRLNDLNNPRLVAHADCMVNATDLLGLLSEKKSEGANGNIKAVLDIQGKLDDLFHQQTIRNMMISGKAELNIQDADLVEMNKHINQLSGNISFKQDLVIHDLELKTNEGNMSINGVIENASALLFASGKGHADLQIQADKIKVSDWIIVPENKDKNINEKNSLLSGLSIHAQLKANELEWEKVIARALNTEISYTPQHIEVHNFDAQLFGGQVKLYAKMSGELTGAKTLQTIVHCTAVDIQKLFVQLDNFGQKEFTDKQLSGKYAGKIEMSAAWNERNELMKEMLTTIADVHITEGAITQYEPMQKLSKFANIDDLKNIRFADLKNTILIHKGMITIPEMELQNNALNLTLSGTQSFAGALDYKVKLRLSELLKNKRKPSENEFGEEDETGKGMYLFISIKGTTDQPKFTYDKLAVKQKVKADLKKEQETIKEVLKKELGIGKDKSIKEKKTDNDELEFEEE